MRYFYKLNSELELNALSKDMEYVVNAMDGQNDFSSPAFLEKHRKIAEEMCRSKIAFRCCKGYSFQEPGPIRGVFWAITGICNLKCEHCYMSSPVTHKPPFDIDTLIKIMDKLASAGATELILTGGEVFTLDCLSDLLDHASDIGMDISNILTNATLITQEKLDMFKRRGYFPHFHVSFDGVGHHSRIRGIGWAEENTLRGIRLLLKNGFRVSVTTCVDSENLVALPETYECMKELKIEEWGVGRPMHFGCAKRLTLPDTASFVKACEDIQLRWLRDNRPMTLGLEGLYSYRAGKKDGVFEFNLKMPACHECSRFPYLSEDGRLMPCSAYTDSDLAMQFPNLLDNGVYECLESETLKKTMNITYEDVLEQSPECKDCDYLNKCRTGCRASALINSGSVFQKDPYSCMIMKEHLQEQFYIREAEYDK